MLTHHPGGDQTAITLLPCSCKALSCLSVYLLTLPIPVIWWGGGGFSISRPGEQQGHEISTISAGRFITCSNLNQESSQPALLHLFAKKNATLGFGKIRLRHFVGATNQCWRKTDSLKYKLFKRKNRNAIMQSVTDSFSFHRAQATL